MSAHGYGYEGEVQKLAVVTWGPFQLFSGWMKLGRDESQPRVHTETSLQQIWHKEQSYLLALRRHWSTFCLVCRSFLGFIYLFLFFSRMLKVFPESTGREPLLRGSPAPSDHIAQLLPSCTVSAGWGAPALSVRQIHSFSQTEPALLLRPLPHRPPLILPAATRQRPGAQTRTTKGAALHSHLRQTTRLSYRLKYTPSVWGRQEGVLITGCSSPRN